MTTKRLIELSHEIMDQFPCPANMDVLSYQEGIYYGIIFFSRIIEGLPDKDQMQELIKKDFVTPRFGKNWPEHAKENYTPEGIIRIAHTNGRQVVLYEQMIEELKNKLEK